MPAQNPDSGNSRGDSVRSESSGITSSFQSKIPILNSKSRSFFLFLVSSVAIILLVTFLFLINTVSKTPGTAFQTDNLTFTNPFVGGRFEELIALGLQEKDRTEASYYLTKAFLTLSNDYLSNPSTEKRQALLKLAEYLENNLPETKITKASVADIPCKDKSCGGILNYSDELLAIKNQVETNDAIDQFAKKVILSNLEGAAWAAGSDDTTGQFNSLSSVFQDLRDVWRRNNDESLKALAEQTLALMEKANPSYFQLESKAGFFELK
ncbi:hypothetical protein A3J17_02505 [Candidatus Curtissbacteria bacterium RIFCSPLOWO2_02_FULL_40_11]|uniref:Uncharacterized protein n=2 Tax=Candidatus Curtissiibacteriota TaxID=1752717 RepID=A0A1F5GB29_9BACT|nr:MAG: hypothetical protein A3D04_00805 [Candidatus Curtissbacteria bacterium RIFCSPHIGHO2_02_FULL_40_16b]OGE00572.1 MAG: hypothetical protein A3J17_02505 [Candidatus Curtissbacteria bacterium RIFCSPLOWO2_02_FULL_40_11]OGE14023.1 MAG: hypothetical protein A3G14_00385 [Candidatus Curtissbacteria bacterium RIFCSPLOWO2_12_FULL_38_9]